MDSLNAVGKTEVAAKKDEEDASSRVVHAITLPRHIRRLSFHYPSKWRMKCTHPFSASVLVCHSAMS